MGAPLSAFAIGQLNCSVVELTQLAFMREGQAGHLHHYRCQVTGGRLDGFVVNATSVWEINGNQGRLLGSVGVAWKGDAAVVYEAQEGSVHNLKMVDGQAVAWESNASATIRLATGSAAGLSGRTFTMHGRHIALNRFQVDARLRD